MSAEDVRANSTFVIIVRQPQIILAGWRPSRATPEKTHFVHGDFQHDSIAAARGMLPRCYPIVPLIKPAPDDCASVVEMMLEGDKASAPMHFAKDPSQGFKVPHRWINGTCLVEINLVKVEEDTMKLSELAFAAATIMHLCTGRPSQINLGGSIMAGPDLDMRVLLSGSKPIRKSGYLESKAALQLGGQSNLTTTQGVKHGGRE
ncbi:MAG: hypothetical protein Q9219_006713 [cf. Caloplaca sp. 3 TL-2023]